MMETLEKSWIGGESEEDEIYKENILDHFRNPRNFGKLENYSFKSSKFNPACGDHIELFVLFEDSRVKEARFIGKGCAISMASASMLTEKIKEMKLEELKKLKESFALEPIGVELGVVRKKCGLLPLRVLAEGIKKMEEENEQADN